ncbi:MAG TPA: hypothetical protein VGK06_08305 [Methanosarcina sp.]|jgi:TfoX/Sxy family transcriptional regulator of competence genes
MKNGNSTLDFSLKFSSRESLLKANAELIEQIQKRVNTKRFKPAEGESLKLAYYRILISAIQAHNSILRDSELDAIQKRIEALESTQANPGGTPVYTPVFEAVE